MLGSTLEEIVDLCFAEHDGQHAVLEAVVVEDVGKAGRDNHSKAPILKCPWRMFATGAAAKVDASQKDARSLCLGSVQFEIFNERAIFAAGPVPEQKLTKACSFDSFEELFGNDLIGI